MHNWQIKTFCFSKYLASIFTGSNSSFLEFHIHCLRPVSSIRQPFVTKKTIVIEQNLNLSPLLSLCIFSQYLKLSQVPTSLWLVFCFLIYCLLAAEIFLSFFCKALYETESPELFKKVMASTQAPTKWRYKQIRRGR